MPQTFHLLVLFCHFSFVLIHCVCWLVFCCCFCCWMKKWTNICNPVLCSLSGNWSEHSQKHRAIKLFSTFLFSNYRLSEQWRQWRRRFFFFSFTLSSRCRETPKNLWKCKENWIQTAQKIMRCFFIVSNLKRDNC